MPDNAASCVKWLLQQTSGGAWQRNDYVVCCSSVTEHTAVMLCGMHYTLEACNRSIDECKLSHVMVVQATAAAAGCCKCDAGNPRPNWLLVRCDDWPAQVWWSTARTAQCSTRPWARGNVHCRTSSTVSSVNCMTL